MYYLMLLLIDAVTNECRKGLIVANSYVVRESVVHEHNNMHDSFNYTNLKSIIETVTTIFHRIQFRTNNWCR